MNGTWTVVDLAGKPAAVYEPPSGRPRFGILHLHDYGQYALSLRDRPAFTCLFDDFRLACVCPDGDDSWWADRVCPEFDPHMTPERYVLDHVATFFQSRWGLSAQSIGLLGLGMGGQGALRLAFKYPDRFPVVAALAAAIEYHLLYGQDATLDGMYDSKEQCRQDTAILHVSPLKAPPHIFFCVDPDDVYWFRGNDRLHEKLTALGIAHEADLTTRAGGDSWDYLNHQAGRAVRFVAAGLEQQSRRLL
jgi:S-formylglutathione hydrolase